jgi:hypothetical protein
MKGGGGKEQKERDHYAYHDIDGWILERQDRVVWTGLIWLRIGTSGGLL